MHRISGPTVTAAPVVCRYIMVGFLPQRPQ